MNDRDHHDEDGGDPRRPHDEAPRQDVERRESLSFSQVVGSTLAAVIGVQSSRNRERDFTRGKPGHFIAAGIVFTVLFVLGMMLVVNLVLG